ncbi:hypothetical protein BJ742DRAFT_767577 [Cladochytrium replicatum]|nr:hypothetical protein BJ742DRAFT_767577 [Cladochytrium replicatum]
MAGRRGWIISASSQNERGSRNAITRGTHGAILYARKSLLMILPAELLARLFSFCDSPRTYAAVCHTFLRISKDPYARAAWFISQYGSKLAFYHAFRSHRPAFNPDVGRFMLIRGAGLPRFVIQYVVREYHQRRASTGISAMAQGQAGGQADPQGGQAQGGVVVPAVAQPGASVANINLYGESIVPNRSFVSTENYAFFVTQGFQLYGASADFKDDDSMRFERTLYGSSNGNNTQTIETIRTLLLNFKFVPINGSATPLDETIFTLSKLDLSLLRHLWLNGLELTEDLNDLVIERVLWRSDITDAILRAHISHGFRISHSTIKKGLQMARPATLMALRAHVPQSQLQKLAEDTVVDIMGPAHRTWIFTAESIDFLRHSFNISDDVIERALYVRPPSLYAAGVAIALSNGTSPPEKNIHDFPATRCYFKSNPCLVWRWVLRAFGQRHPFTIACFDDALSRAAGDRDLHALHDIFLDAGVRFRPRHIKILACRVLHRDMASNALHLMKVLRTQLTSHFRSPVPTANPRQSFLSPFIPKHIEDVTVYPASSAMPVCSLQSPHHQYFQYPEDADEFGDHGEWIRLLKEEIVENREWIERMKTTQLEGGPRGGVYRVNRPPDDGVKFLDEAREAVAELSASIQHQNGIPNMIQSMMGQGRRQTKKIASPLGNARASMGSGSDTFGGGAGPSLNFKTSGNGNGSSTGMNSQYSTPTLGMPAATASRDKGTVCTPKASFGLDSIDELGLDGCKATLELESNVSLHLRSDTCEREGVVIENLHMSDPVEETELMYCASERKIELSTD